MEEMLKYLKSTTLTVEDFKESKINEILELKSHFSDFSNSTLSLVSKYYEEGNLRLACVAHVILSSINIYKNLWKEQKNNPYKVNIPDEILEINAFPLVISKMEIDFLYTIYKEIQNPLLKAIICEVILIDKRRNDKFRIASIAIDCYVNTPFPYRSDSINSQSSIVIEELYFDYFKRLIRAHKIALLFNIKEKVKYTEEKILSIFYEYSERKEIINFDCLLESFEDFKEVHINCKDIASKLENHALSFDFVVGENRDDYPRDLLRSVWLSGNTFFQAAKFYKKSGNYEKWLEMRVLCAETGLTQAIRNNNFGAKSELISDAIGCYRKIIDDISFIGDRSFIETTKAEIFDQIGKLEYVQLVFAKLYLRYNTKLKEVKVTYSKEISKSINDFLDFIKEKDNMFKIISLCFFIDDFDRDRLNESANKLLDEDSAFKVASTSEVDSTGRKRKTHRHISNSDGTNQNNDHHKFLIFKQYCMILESMIYHKLIFQDKYDLESIEQFTDKIVSNSNIVQQNQKKTLQLALFYGFQGKLIESIHLLMPAFENLVRNFLSSNNVSVLKKNNGSEEYVSLDELIKQHRNLLNNGMFFNHSDEFYFFISKINGFNLRNEIAHGTILDEDHKINLFYVNFLILVTKILIISIIKSNSSNKEFKSYILNSMNLINKLDPTEFQEHALSILLEFNEHKQSMFFHGDSPPESAKGLK